MKIKVFQYVIPFEDELVELNAYLNHHKIFSMKHHVVQSADRSLLIFVVESTDDTAFSDNNRSFAKVDYKKLLNSTEFEGFNRLRELRKQVADAEGVPVYAVYSNAQLAGMIQQKVKNLEEMSRIEGIGDSKVEKYGAKFLEILVKEPVIVEEAST